MAQLVTESLVVSLAGAGAGLVLAQWSLRLLRAFQPDSIPDPERIGIDWRVLLFGLASGAATTLLFGLAPALAVPAPISTAR